ncbi:MAG: universal stress protein [Symploca sp. SIO3C6]|nr:universal stress protein [Symploca sp. SIO3C6]NET03964.1 universal stress protein [Symploca sp. SIO2B6]
MFNLIRPWLVPRRRLAIAEACLIGLVSGFSAVLLKYSIGWLGSWRIKASLALPPSLVLPIFGLSLGVLGGILIESLALEATGSGVPQIKGALAQFPIALNLRVALVKLVSSVVSMSAGLTLGRQGPTVHIGAALAAQFTRWVPTSPEHRRQMIAAGAGAGLAAGFNAPLASVIFIVEELLHDVSNLTLGTAILASFIGAVVSRLLGGGSLDLNLELTSFADRLWAPEIPFYLLLGVLAGLLGSLFNQGILASLSLYQRLKLILPLKIGLAGMICGLMVSLLPPEFRNNSGLQQLLITGDASWQFTSLAFVAYFFLTLVSYGSGAPGGLFHPSLVLGSALGYLVGVGEFHLLGFGAPINYALVGMGAFFSAVSKVPITAIVIVFEMTMDFNLVLPLMISCVVSYMIADNLAKGSLYQRLLEWKGYTSPTRKIEHASLAGLRASDLMQPRVETLASQMTLDQAVQAFSRSHHRGFPVVDKGLLVGIITQTDIANGAQRRLSGKTTIAQIMTPKPVTVLPTDSLSHVLYLLNLYQVSRLPVTEGRKLLGIITRADIIRAEAKQLSGETDHTGSSVDPSYVVYQTRAPAIGRGRMLVPIANPETAPVLLRIATAIARDRDYEIECLQVIIVSRSYDPTQTEVNTTKSRKLLQEAQQLGQNWNISIHTQIRVSHDTAQAILETINERHINLILMGWKGLPSKNPGRIFGSIVDTLIRQAPCELVLVKLGQKDRRLSKETTVPFCSLPLAWYRWLVSIAGGPPSNHVLKIMPALLAMSKAPEILVTQVFPSSTLTPDTTALKQAKNLLNQQVNVQVEAIAAFSNSVSEGVIKLASELKCDVVVLGASREGLLQQVIKGNIPEAIARGVDTTVILLRGVLD